jgi:hypothetical protein
MSAAVADCTVEPAVEACAALVVAVVPFVLGPAALVNAATA